MMKHCWRRHGDQVFSRRTRHPLNGLATVRQVTCVSYWGKGEVRYVEIHSVGKQGTNFETSGFCIGCRCRFGTASTNNFVPRIALNSSLDRKQDVERNMNNMQISNLLDSRMHRASNSKLGIIKNGYTLRNLHIFVALRKVPQVGLTVGFTYRRTCTVTEGLP